MLLHVYTLISNDNPAAEQRFIRSLCVDGEWQSRARSIAPELIATELLRQQEVVPAPLYLCMDHWTSAEAYHQAFRSRTVQQLFRLRRELVSSCLELGTFAFPSLTESVEFARALVN